MTVSVTRTKSARDYHTQKEGYLYKRVDWNSSQITSATKFYVGVLPADCYPYETIVRVNSTFDNPVIVGSSASSSTASFVAIGDVTWGTTGTYHVDRCAGHCPKHARRSCVCNDERIQRGDRRSGRCLGEVHAREIRGNKSWVLIMFTPPLSRLMPDRRAQVLLLLYQIGEQAHSTHRRLRHIRFRRRLLVARRLCIARHLHRPSRALCRLPHLRQQASTSTIRRSGRSPSRLQPRSIRA